MRDKNKMAALTLILLGLVYAWASAPACAAGFVKERKVQQQTELPLRKESFLYSAPVLGEELAPGQIYRLHLPPEVLMSVASPESDIAIFDASGSPLGQQLYGSTKKSNAIAYTMTELFPLWREKRSQRPEDPTLALILKDGKLEPRMLSQAQQEGVEKTLYGYVLELPHRGIRPENMILDWQSGKAATIAFTLETSDDLSVWRRILGTATLTRITNAQGGVLEGDGRVRLNGPRLGKYLRLVFERGYEPAAVSSITLDERQRDEHLQQRWERNIPGVVIPSETGKVSKQGHGLKFDLRTNPHDMGQLPISEINLSNLKLGDYYSVQIRVRNNRNTTNFRSAGSTNFYYISRTMENGPALEQNPPVQLNGEMAQEILLVTAPGVTLREDLTLQVVYMGKTLYFLANDKGPFTVAWGFDPQKGRPAARQGASLVKLLNDPESAPMLALGANEQIVGPAVEKTAPEAYPQVWRTWLLWILLGLGVAMVMYMAIRTLRSLSKEKKDALK